MPKKINGVKLYPNSYLYTFIIQSRRHRLTTTFIEIPFQNIFLIIRLVLQII